MGRPGFGKRSLGASHLDERAVTFLDGLLRLGRSPSGKAEACKASIRRFDSDPPLFEDCDMHRVLQLPQLRAAGQLESGS